MADSDLRTRTADELRSLAENNEVEQLTDALSLLHSWGIHDPSYLPVLGMLLAHEDPQVVRLTLGIMLSFDSYQVVEFSELKEYLPVFQAMLATQPNAISLIVALCGPSEDLVPQLKVRLAQFPEETCDLVVEFGPIAKDLVPDLMQILGSEDWDTVWAAVDAIGAIGPDAAQAVPILEQLTRHSSGIITGSACVALENITGIPRDNWPRGPHAD